ncbi:MAG: IS1634 family transposase [Gemmataceae bacterium]|nr:IS1634 family transposase [Gemmataceae bacterium]
MFVAVVPNRNSPPAILLRESYREGAQVKSRTLANLSRWPPEKVEALRQVLRGGRVGLALPEAFAITRSRPHGHVVAALGTLRRLGLESLLASKRSRERDLCTALVVARILEPRSKLATARALAAETLHSSLGEVLGVESADEDDLYGAMDWLRSRQAHIEQQLARRHLLEGTLTLYDLTSTYFEGRHCPLARLGYSRDGKRGTLQIVFGLLTDASGCPVAVEVFAGDTSDPETLAAQVQKVREHFGLRQLVLVGDRGLLTRARIREDLQPVAGLGWITALRAPAIRRLVDSGALQLGLFDERDLAEIRSPDYPGERLIVCRNPLLAEERARKRADLLAATETELNRVVAATRRSRNRLQGREHIALRVGAVLGRFKMAKHFRLRITDGGLQYERDRASIAREAALDGIYVIRTSVSQDALGAEDTVRAYKRLAAVERAFRSLKSVDLKVRPIHHRLADRVRAHVFLCMLAYYVEWHMRQALAPILFDDHDKPAGERLRPSVVAPARRSLQAEDKARSKRTDDDLPVHSFQSLLRDLATVAKNHVQPTDKAIPPFDMITSPTSLQQRALDLLGVTLRV